MVLGEHVVQLLLLSRASMWLWRNCFLPDHELQESGNTWTEAMAQEVCLVHCSVQAFRREYRHEHANVSHPGSVCPSSWLLSGSLQLLLQPSCWVLSQVLESDGTRDAALREEQHYLLVCSKSATRPPRAQFKKLLGLIEPNMATQLLP